jgi:hypothetical protein
MPRYEYWQKLIPAAPCDTCHKREQCRVEELACPSYVEYVREGEPEHASGVPDRKNYEMVYSGKFLIEQEV